MSLMMGIMRKWNGGVLDAMNRCAFSSTIRLVFNV